jgi:hypothetical protein
MAVFGAGLWQNAEICPRAEKEFKSSGMSNRLAFFLGASAGLLALAVHSVVDFNLHIPANAILGVDAARAFEQQPAVRHGKILVERPAARENLTTALAGGIFYLGVRNGAAAAKILAGARGAVAGVFFARTRRGLGKGVCRRAAKF